MFYFLVLLLIEPGVTVLGKARKQIYFPETPEQAAIITYNCARNMPKGCDIQVRFYSVDVDTLAIKEEKLQKVVFQNAE